MAGVLSGREGQGTDTEGRPRAMRGRERWPCGARSEAAGKPARPAPWRWASGPEGREDVSVRHLILPGRGVPCGSLSTPGAGHSSGEGGILRPAAAPELLGRVEGGPGRKSLSQAPIRHHVRDPEWRAHAGEATVATAVPAACGPERGPGHTPSSE